MSRLLFDGADWDFDTIRRTYDAVEAIADRELGLSLYPNQIEIITTEQMLDAYSSVGMPLMYKHWSFGKRFAHDEVLYRHGLRGLAYEIVINSSPCIVYMMEENTMTMQTLVMAHAAFGHNHFFKNNHLFQQWTDARGILDYLEFAKGYIASCEERHGAAAVERLLDAAHALMDQGVHRFPRRRVPDLSREQKREREREAYQEQVYNDLWRTVPKGSGTKTVPRSISERRRLLDLPEENVLYFLEKKAPRLRQWQREVIRIVRHLAQYFYPQKQTKMMNEGCATTVHYYIMNKLYEQGLINDGAMLEFLHSHTSVVFQPGFDDQRFGGLNPYALGFNMMCDIQRICTEPTAEDREWFPEIAGNDAPVETLRDAWAHYRDESFILQFLSPALMRKMRMFKVRDDAELPYLVVQSIHNERGYRELRRSLAHQYDLSRLEPVIQIVDVDLDGDRRLMLRHEVVNGRVLDPSDVRPVLRHLAELWGYPVVLQEIAADPQHGERVQNEQTASPSGLLLDRD